MEDLNPVLETSSWIHEVILKINSKKLVRMFISAILEQFLRSSQNGLAGVQHSASRFFNFKKLFLVIFNKILFKMMNHS